MYVVLKLFCVCTLGFICAEYSYLRTSCFEKNSYLRKKFEKCAFEAKESEIVKNWSIDVFSDEGFIVISHV